MKKSFMLFLFAIFSLIFLSNRIIAQENNQGNKSYVKIKTMKIVNGDTIVTEKEFTGEGNMNIEDTSMNNNLGGFNFNMYSGTPDSSFINNFSNIENMMKNFNLGMNNDLFKNFGLPEMPDFNRSFGIDSMIKEFNFNDSNYYFPNSGKNKMIIKSFNDDDLKGYSDSSDKAKTGMDVHIYGKDENGKSISFNKKIIIQNNHSDPQKNIKDDFQVDIFPNPADNYFNVSFQLDAKNITLITITDIDGKQMQKEEIDKTDGIYTRQFDMKDYSKGTYFINIKQGKKSVSKQIIVE